MAMMFVLVTQTLYLNLVINIICKRGTNTGPPFLVCYKVKKSDCEVKNVDIEINFTMFNWQCLSKKCYDMDS
jgi:hypothetical protein